MRLSIGTGFTCRITNMREEIAPLRLVQALCEPANNIPLNCLSGPASTSTSG